ncbi:MAG: SGNH/GDSL hydrolase family protein [Clostridia bacterium]|nr:SGNH/GDSL hydrolase family protein [Clostridia bacterium]
MKTIVFQGDSITDVGRNRDNIMEPGMGYPLLVSAELGFKYPGEYKFINEGVSGDRVVDVYARIRRDIINNNPDILTILIGVNDVWHELGDEPNGVDNEKYFKVYCDLIEEVKRMCPQCEIYILEPFVLKASATASKWDIFSREVAKRAESAKKCAEKFSLTFIPLQEDFNKACEKAPASYWLGDGVHPTFAGHELIAKKLIENICK